ncbi:hypothetical protein Dvina_02820 [Dactylosporangium vinaceum]|uniref:Uncharacterized protein n=2 Tax=Dactylosporangium TaxID=35753 RepID=A0ABV5M182_9ACTN|nr:hypothetical protein [Dactylosporangium vinaceum]UAB97155.1 hypothetical protein Dvina_02820 [Dactylosporangium vinaceum]
MSDVDYGQYEAGQESGSLDQLHEASGSEADYGNQFGVYEQDHHAAESTDFSQGKHVEYDAPGAVHFESDDYTNYSHDASVDDHVFAAEGSESSHQAEFSELDALKARFDNAFVSGTEFSGSDAALTAA